METMMFGGRERRYLLHLPPGDTEGLPLIIALHPLGSNAKLMEAMTDLSPKADRHGFVMAYPEGTGPGGGMRSWNALFCCREAKEQEVDDIGFVSELIDQLKERHGTQETFVTGMSNGGMLTHTAGIKLADKVDAIAPVAATIGPGILDLQPSRPVPTLIIHGAEDGLILYDDTRYEILFPARESVKYWVRGNGCNPYPVVKDVGGIVTERYEGGRDGSEVTLHMVNGAGHVWPGSRIRPISDSDPHTLDATGTIVNFFLSRTKKIRA